MSNNENRTPLIVTGGLGFIGSNFVRSAVQRGERVILVDALSYAGRFENLADCWLAERVAHVPAFGSLPRRFTFQSGQFHCEELKDAAGKIPAGWRVNNCDTAAALQRELESWQRGTQAICYLIADVANLEIWETVFAYSARLVHFAAETHVDRSILSAEPFIFSDVHGTFAILDVARRSGWKGRILHISTDEVYGVAEDRPFDESSPLLPRNPYSVAKAAADRMVAAFAQTYGLDTVIVRPSNNFGPYQYPEKLVPLMTIRALLNQPLPVYGDGRQEREWLFVRDCVRGVEAALAHGRSGEAYNLGGGHPQPNINVVKEILRIVERPESLINYVKDRPGHDRKYWLDFTKAEQELGWKPQARFEEAIKETVNWYVKNVEWWQPIIEQDAEYTQFFQAWYKDHHRDTEGTQR